MKLNNEHALALKKAIKDGKGVNKAIDTFMTAIETDTTKEIARVINRRLLPRRKKYAETMVKASEMGMSLEQIREFNAYSDGYNARAIEIQLELQGEEPEITKELIALDPATYSTAAEAKAEVDGEEPAPAVVEEVITEEPTV